MTAALFKPSLALVLAHEGGYVNHPKDPGGATNKGVTQKVYDNYRRLKGRPVRSVKYIEDYEVEEIYNHHYWRLVSGDELPAGLDYAVFDFAVNSGVSRAGKFLQRVLGFKGSDIDGIIGTGTLAAAREACRQNEYKVIADLCQARLAWLHTLGTFPTFGRGWTRRVIGDYAGVQSGDHGVIDYATGFAKEDQIYIMPSEIGSKLGEVRGKAYETSKAA